MFPVLLLFSQETFFPKGQGYLDELSGRWLQIGSDFIIILSYFSISLILVYFLKRRPDIPFQKIFWVFCAFILAGGMAHLMELWALWYPDYGLSGFFKAITAGFAFYMAEELVRLIPKTLALPNLLELEKANQALAQEIQKHRQTETELRLNGQVIGITSLAQDITKRKMTEQALQEAKNQLEIRVEERTKELTQVITKLQREIEQRQQVEADLKEREEQYRSVVDNVKDIIFQTDINGYWTFLNPAWSEITGFAIADSIGKFLLDYVHPDDWQRSLEEWLPLIEGKKEYFRHDVRYLTASGGYRWIEVFAQLTYSAAGTVTGTCGTLYDITERHLSEAALQASESRYRAIVEDQTEIICRFLPNGTLTFVNEAYCSYFGKSREELIGHQFLPLMPQVNAENVKLQLACLTLENPVATYEYQVVTPEGEIRTLTRTNRAIFDEQGNLIEFQAVGRDITERKQAEAALQESEERFRSLVAHIPGVVYRCACDSDRTLEFISDVIEEISGYPASDFLQNRTRTLTSLMEPQDRVRVEQTITECVAKQQPYVLKYRIAHADGTVRWLYEKGQGVFATDGSLLWLDGVIFDSTEYKQTQEELRSRDEQFRQLTENIHEVFFLTTPDLSKMLYISPAYEEVWGRTAKNLYEQPQSWLESVHPEDRDRILAALARHIQDKQEFEEEYRIVRPDNSVRWVWVRAFHVLNKAGSSERIAGIAEDVTERKLAEVEIVNALAKEKELGDLKSRFISITSHEFRTPLTTILSTTELLEYYEWTKQEEVEQLHLIEDAVKHLLDLLEDLLFIGTAEAGQVRFHPEPLELNEFCQQLVAEIQRGIETRQQPLEHSYPAQMRSQTVTTSVQRFTGVQHTLTFTCQGQRFLACMDKKLLRQLLCNLLLNAIKYSPAGGKVHFELICQDDKAIFRVQDRGIGIPKEDHPRLFEFFHRGKNVGAIAGTGLGLAIVKTCVDLHRGEITVDSEVGVGTRFTVSLPLKNPFFSLTMLNSLPPHTGHDSD
ncbi:MAG: PAS domain S-box protein [Cyanobacteriota bacterium]